MASVEINLIDQVIAGYHARGYSRSTVHLYAQQLRAFFRFAEDQGWCKQGLADGIMPSQRHPGDTTFAGVLDDILCIHEERTVPNDNTVRYKRRLLQLPADRHRRHYVKATVRVHAYPDGTLAVFHGPRCLARYRATGEPIDTQTRQAA